MLLFKEIGMFSYALILVVSYSMSASVVADTGQIKKLISQLSSVANSDFSVKSSLLMEEIGKKIFIQRKICAGEFRESVKVSALKTKNEKWDCSQELFTAEEEYAEVVFEKRTSYQNSVHQKILERLTQENELQKNNLKKNKESIRKTLGMD